MPLSSIAKMVGCRRDGSLDTAIKVLADEIAADFDRPSVRVDLPAKIKAGSKALPNTKISEERRRAAQDYLGALAEPERAMFFKFRDGIAPSAIARAMGLEPRAVIKTLARIYSDLRFIVY